MAWRNLLNIRRNPQLLVFATIQPIIFVLMFRYVFGGAFGTAALGDVPYVDFLMPGVFVQTVVFGALTHRVGLADDLKRGSSTASARCRWPARRCWSGAPSPTSPATCSSSC